MTYSKQEIVSFDAFGFAAPLMDALRDKGFTAPSPVQAQAIPHLLEGRDVIARAQTGTGKTAAFSLPILKHLNLRSSATQALIIAPTRELAIQIAAEIESLAVHQKVSLIVLCGGQPYRPQLDQLRAGAQIVIGTPGRILDHLEKNTLKLDQLATFILDEADEMLRMGFIDDVKNILSKIPEKKQIALFSATMPPPIRKIANTYLKDPVSIEIQSETATVKSIEQRYLLASPHQKPEALLRVLAAETYQSVIVFVRTKSSTEEVATRLQEAGYSAMAIHGDLSQQTREQIVAQFRQGVLDILVATDIAARGLDVERVTHVINYDVPHDSETYVHRIGRTGRAGRSGITILFLTQRESRVLYTIERHTKQKIEKAFVPDDHAIQKAREQRLITELKERIKHPYLTEYQEMISQILQQNPEISAIDAAAILALLLNKDQAWKRKLPAFKGVKEHPLPEQESRSSQGRQSRKKPSRFDGPLKSYDQAIQTLYRIEVGQKHGVKPGNIVGAIANEGGLQSRFITGLKIHDEYSTVRLPQSLPKETQNNIHKAWVCGRQLKLTMLNEYA